MNISFILIGRCSAFLIDSYRWYIMIAFAGNLISSGFCMVGFSSIAALICAIFDTPTLVPTLCVLLYLIAFIPMNFVVITMLSTHGMRVCVSDSITFIMHISADYRISLFGPRVLAQIKRLTDWKFHVCVVRHHSYCIGITISNQLLKQIGHSLVWRQRSRFSYQLILF